jgi:hypothetical protein
MAKTLLAYQRRHGLDTIAAIIARWAPPADGNDTAAYIAAVARRMNCAADAPLDLSDRNRLQALMAAVIQQEQGAQPFTPAELAAAVVAANDRSPAPTVSA